MRLVVGLIVIVAAAALLELEEPALGVGSQFGLIAPGEATGANFVLAVVCSLAMIGWLVLVRTAAWQWLTGARREGEALAGSPQTAKGHAAIRWPARAATCVVILLSGCALGHLYWNLLPPTAPTIVLPNPNGYDEIVLAGKGLNWAAIPNQGADEAGMDACRAFVQVNAAPLAHLRRAFAMPCRNPVVFDAVYRFTGGSNQEFRSVARAW